MSFTLGGGRAGRIVWYILPFFSFSRYGNLWDPDTPDKQVARQKADTPFELVLEDAYDRTLARQIYNFACKNPSFNIESIQHQYGEGLVHNINLIRCKHFLFLFVPSHFISYF